MLFIIIFTIYSCKQDVKQEVQLDVEKIKMELDSIMELDQVHRSELQVLFKEGKQGTEEFESLVEKQIKIDSSNLIYVEDLIQRYGSYPGNSFVGHSRGDVAFFVLQHAHDSIHTKYIDLILRAGENNELKKNAVAMFHDRYLLRQGKPQIYGTQVGRKKTIDSITGEEIFVQFAGHSSYGFYP